MQSFFNINHIKKVLKIESSYQWDRSSVNYNRNLIDLLGNPVKGLMFPDSDEYPDLSFHCVELAIQTIGS